MEGRKLYREILFKEKSDAEDFVNKYENLFIPDKSGVSYRLESTENVFELTDSKYFPIQVVINSIHKFDWEGIVEDIFLRGTYCKYNYFGYGAEYKKGFFYCLDQDHPYPHSKGF